VYELLANTVLAVHAAFVTFVVLTVPCIYIGTIRNWRWIRIYWLRVIHLVGIFIVVAQSWAGAICPLTTLEMWLRENARLGTYNGSFIGHWLQKLIYWDLPAWAFIVVYSLFALLVIFTWYVVPPTKNRRRGITSI
jgi:polyferredoxin